MADKKNQVLNKLRVGAAYGAVIVGVLLSVAAPLLPRYQNLRLESAQAELEAGRKQYQADIKEAQAKKGKAQARALASLRENLEQLESEVSEARAGTSGSAWSLYAHWLGRVLLILGLLTLVVGAAAATQKALLVVLGIVLLTSLGGAHLNIGGNTTTGTAQAAP
jgi:hypothetical protein